MTCEKLPSRTPGTRDACKDANENQDDLLALNGSTQEADIRVKPELIFDPFWFTKCGLRSELHCGLYDLFASTRMAQEMEAKMFDQHW